MLRLHADTEPMSHRASSEIWQPPALRNVLGWPLDLGQRSSRWLIRALTLLARQQVLSINGLHHVQSAHDPFILALNHSTRNEAVLVPALLILYRGGQLIHFLADWNYRLIPGIGLIYSRAETVTVTRKPARPRILNALKPLYRDPLSALERSRAHLRAGRSIGIFPEGTINRDPHRLLPGRRGAARLSLETGAPVLPVGIRFPRARPGEPINDRAAIAVEIGAPLLPPREAVGTVAPLAAVRAWHAVVMTEIGRLSHKTWAPPTWEIHHEQP